MSENSVFPVPLKQADIKQIHKKDSRCDKENYRPVSILPNYLKFMGVACIHKWTSTPILFFLNKNLDLERYIVHSNVYLLWLKNANLL